MLFRSGGGKLTYFFSFVNVIFFSVSHPIIFSCVSEILNVVLLVKLR